MMFLGRGGGGGKGASSGSFGSHFTIPAVETKGELRSTHPLTDGTATQVFFPVQLRLRVYGLAPVIQDPGLCFHSP